MIATPIGEERRGSAISIPPSYLLKISLTLDNSANEHR